MRRVRACVLVGALLLTVGCSGSGDGKGLVAPPSTAVSGDTVPDFTTVPGDPSAPKPWTVFVYMAADNNLEDAAVLDVQEMQQGVSDDVNLVVMMDRAVGFDDTPIEGLGDFTGVRLFQVTKSGLVDLQLRGDATMTDPQVLVQSGKLVYQKYPAQQYGLVLWDHAGGWHGFAQDESGGGSMNPDQVADAIGQIESGAGIGKLSILAFDTCVMSQFEVAAAMAPYTDRMLASAETAPWHGYDYSVVGQATTGGPDEFASAFISGFQAQATVESTEKTITQSYLDLTQIDGLRTAIDDLGSALTDDPSSATAFLQAANDSLAYAYLPEQNINFDFRDLGQIATELSGSGTSLAAPADAISSALSKLVITHIEGSNFTGSSGLSVYAPISIESYDTRFADLSTAGPWASVLDAAYNGGADQVAGVDTSFVGDPAYQFQADSGEMVVAAEVDPSAIGSFTDITVFYGAFVPAQDGYPDLCLLLGQAAGVSDDSSSVVGGSVSLYQLGLSEDGGASGLLGVFAAVPNADNTALVLSVPVRYMPPGVSVDDGLGGWLQLAIQDGAVAQTSLLLVTPDNTIANVVPDPAGTIQTIVQQLGKDGSVVPVPSETYTDPPSLPADLSAITIVPKPVAPGDGSVLGNNLCVGVATTDSGGSNQFVFAQYVA